MTNTINELGQPVGFAVKNFVAPTRPNFDRLARNSVRVEPISMDDLPSLYAAFSMDLKGGNWTYMPYGPFADSLAFTEWAKLTCFGEDPKFYTIFLDDNPAGLASYLRIEPKVGCIEIGHIHLSPLFQRTRGGTEALLLMIDWVFGPDIAGLSGNAMHSMPLLVVQHSDWVFPSRAFSDKLRCINLEIETRLGMLLLTENGRILKGRIKFGNKQTILMQRVRA